MWRYIVAVALLTAEVYGQGFVRFPASAPLRPISPIAGFHNQPIRQTFITPVISDDFGDDFIRSGGISRPRPIGGGGFSGSPCSPSPCGDNTRCEVNSRGIAQCRCIDGYVPDDNTIEGCKPQCTSSSDCPDTHECRTDRRGTVKCMRVCEAGTCGLFATCYARNHRASCQCPPGMDGNPEVQCNRPRPVPRDPPQVHIDLCNPSPCGSESNCRVRGDRPVCSCPRGYEGDPLTRCIRGECIEHNDCPDHQACRNLRCFDPCAGVCGRGADCRVRNHQPVCSCPRNNIGDPFVSCREITEYDVCNPSPCGENTNCKGRPQPGGGYRAVCSCYDNYIGNPLTGCRAECLGDTDCQRNQHCRDNRCRNPCVDGCGDGAYCDARNHRAVCTCPEFFQGDPHNRCYAECTQHDQCPDHQACSEYRCIDPCVGACGQGADCKVENHTPICSCPRSHTGDPFVRCRPFTLADLCADNPCGTNAECTPGKDREGNDRPVCTCPRGFVGNPLGSCRQGDCTEHHQCPSNQACYQYICTSPCYHNAGSVCGEDAICTVKNHVPVCSCPRGFMGDPLSQCRLSPNARVAGRTN